MNSRSIRGSLHLAGIAALMLSGATTQAAAQRVTAVGHPVVLSEAPAHVFELRQNVPEDVRVMQTIVTTALSRVEQPEMPKETGADSTGREAERAARLLYRSQSFFSRGDVSGFYMQGYGYLFTVRWPAGSSFAVYGSSRQVIELNTQLQQLKEQQQAQVDAAREKAQQALAERRESEQARTKAMAAWSDEYRQRLTSALRDAIAGYGSTLRRARPGESITFLADFGGGDSATVTMTVKADALHGSDVEANRRAVQVSVGRSGTSERLRTQLEIMSRIIDTTLGGDAVVVSGGWSTFVGGSAETQYVPGYGVIFRKSARLNTARAFSGVAAGASVVERRQWTPDSTQVAARRAYHEHLDSLKGQTAELLATYGPTLTELADGDWVGIYYDVGSAAALLGGGLDDYLVQARMRDIRQAATQSNPAAWLEQRVVTNEKED